MIRQPQLNFPNRELIVDNFAGGGGASIGIELATGSYVDIAINHDKQAVAMHEANHPCTKHYCESVWQVDPRVVTGGNPVGLAWFSPDCTHHSKARGGKPTSPRVRGLAWIVLKWAGLVRPRVIILENVEEFEHWGPLTRSKRPCKRRRGMIFDRFVSQLRDLGYRVEWQQLRACDYGAPTIRKRLFLIARCDGQHIVWPAPTHGPGTRKPYRTAAEIIDWSIPCPSIFERKRPLAENTLRRIAKGIQRFVIEAERPFIVNLTHSGRVEDVDEPLRTVTGANRGEKAIVTPYIKPYYGDKSSRARGRTPDHPIATQTTENRFALVAPYLVPRYGERPRQEPRCSDITNPLATVVATGNQGALIAPIIERQFGKSGGNPTDEPLGTVTAGGGGKSALVAAFLAKHFGGMTGVEAETPLPTTTTRGTQTQLVSATLTGVGGRAGCSRPHGMNEPTATITAKADTALVSSHLIKLRGTCQHGQPVDQPAPTITASGNHVGEVRAFLLKYYGTNIGQSLNDPLQTVTSKHRFGLVTIHGEEYQIVDIGMRMLTPRELFNAQGFPADYVIDQDAAGNRITKTQQVAKCGNSVCPPVAAAIVRANVFECVKQQKSETR